MDFIVQLKLHTTFVQLFLHTIQSNVIGQKLSIKIEIEIKRKKCIMRKDYLKFHISNEISISVKKENWILPIYKKLNKKKEIPKEDLNDILKEKLKYLRLSWP
jgi:hypothetical protein